MSQDPSNVRARLFDAIEGLLQEQGTADVSLREVARRAGVSHATPGHHFTNKRGMLTAFAAQGFVRLSDTVRDGLAADRPRTGPEVLAAIGRAYVRFAVAHPAVFRLMFKLDEIDPRDPGFRQASDAAFSALSDTVHRCVSEGRARPEQATTIAVAAWSLVHGLASLWIDGRLRARIPNAGDGSVDAETLASDVCALYVSSVFRDPR